MSLLASWQLMLFLCAISFRETLEKVVPVENPRSTGMCYLGKRAEGSKDIAFADCILAKGFRGGHKRRPQKCFCCWESGSLSLLEAKGQMEGQDEASGSLKEAQGGSPGLVSPYDSVLGQQLSPLPLLAAWEQSPLCTARGSELGSQGPASCVPRSRLIPAPRGAVLVQREKDLPAYNWNSFGLRYGRRRAAPQNLAQRQGTSSPGLTGPLGTQSGRRGQGMGGGLEFPVLNQ
ncbi:metastasis-suppressor KiSS-1 [Phyllostomus discolor]|uniref:Metastasis-suppressor KiSS-1 n=1 Tax=Phyllostomus discolor TaxID=89673 RepID=A0A7E6CZT4_9CHIR|nr:metastasis-suppressor KiSS-1 [Phyllostomus discolor]